MSHSDLGPFFRHSPSSDQTREAKNATEKPLQHQELTQGLIAASLCPLMPDSTKPKPARKLNPALSKPVQPDEILAAVIGSTPVSRGEMTKKLWEYIKKNGLQDQAKKTNINADEKLKAVFGGKSQVTMFEMTKLVSAHVK
jgi:chromatin remodeling complex protein RSC6